LNPNIHKTFNNKISLNLNYDLSDEDILYLTEIIIHSEQINNLLIRLSDTLTDINGLKKLLRKISFKKQFTNLRFYIKYLNDEFFNEFLNFISHFNSSVNSIKIKIKYNDERTEEIKTKYILENLIKNDNNNINSIYFINCRFNTEQNINLLKEYISKNRDKLKNIYIYNNIIYNNNFDIDISHMNIVELSYLNLSQINFLPLEKLDLSSNNISIRGIQKISNLLVNSSIKKLNLSNNYLGDEGSSILASGIKKNKSLISLNLSSNYIIYQGIIDIAMAMNSKSDDGEYNSLRT
jgi:hypothetical protein